MATNVTIFERVNPKLLNDHHARHDNFSSEGQLRPAPRDVTIEFSFASCKLIDPRCAAQCDAKCRVVSSNNGAPHHYMYMYKTRHMFSNTVTKKRDWLQRKLRLLLKQKICCLFFC